MKMTAIIMNENIVGNSPGAGGDDVDWIGGDDVDGIGGDDAAGIPGGDDVAESGRVYIVCVGAGTGREGGREGGERRREGEKERVRSSMIHVHLPG